MAHKLNKTADTGNDMLLLPWRGNLVCMPEKRGDGEKQHKHHSAVSPLKTLLKAPIVLLAGLQLQELKALWWKGMDGLKQPPGARPWMWRRKNEQRQDCSHVNKPG